MISKFIEIYNECYKAHSGMDITIQQEPYWNWSITISGETIGYENIYDGCGNDLNIIVKEAIDKLLEYAKVHNITITTRLDV